MNYIENFAARFFLNKKIHFCKKNGINRRSFFVKPSRFRSKKSFNISKNRSTFYFTSYKNYLNKKIRKKYQKIKKFPFKKQLLIPYPKQKKGRAKKLKSFKLFH